jgi:hypothetical protein
MADLSDVSNAVVALLSAALYPNGADAPSPTGLDTRIYAGWPLPSKLDQDMGARPAISHISVWARPEERNTTRYELKWHELSRQPPTLALTIADGDIEPNTITVTLTGTPPPATNPHNVMVMVNGLPYVYSVLPGQSLDDIMTALTALVAAAVPGVTVYNAVMTLPGSARVTAGRVGITGTIRQEVARQEKTFQISIWASTPDVRDSLARFVDPVLKSAFWLNLADQSSARWISRGSVQVDRLQRERAYRRDFLYLAEWATFETLTVTEITQAQLNLYAGIKGAPPQFISTTYS